ncbi:NAD-dependent epimerase/dehydratase family protein [Klenkia taihuensis]|uniref:Nucleoside-diphosphate-sugar epimerase n=1 Tax=Klenkia taihuensis TaxID=1225127 RepID=A0A1I1JYE6_9ACTN|nr:NAD-dependent epimerase/dehydratase family protein [Klenkia taihuensis]GHE10644.1 hypothetical protein GCM10011381_20590 [Klenkia taihuensis]SFC53271.1 Nucleoside-diphosphate-sugar epimerase [Klenkia taihuensis]
MTKRALIGWSGFVGGALLSRVRPAVQLRSTDIQTLPEHEVDQVVCAGAPAEKWRANAEPEADWERLVPLMAALDKSTASSCILVSTVDVFADSCGVDEGASPDVEQEQAYGRHRALLEKFVTDRFDDALIIRLPGMYGPGLKKNLVFDLIHQPDARFANEDSAFQFYDVRDLWGHTLLARDAGLRVVNLATAPVSAKRVAADAFGVDYHCTDRPVAQYDLRTRHADVLAGRSGPYLRTEEEVVAGISAWAAGEKVETS